MKSAESRTKLYQSIAKNGYQLDLRDFKCKKAYCPDKKCRYNQGFDTRVQREVDVAIAMKPIKSLQANPNLDVVVLFAGDGDFYDMVEYFVKTLGKKVYVVGWSASMSGDLVKMCTEVCYLDAIWLELSTATAGGELTNTDVLKLIGVSDAIILAATRKYPDPEHRDQCIDFAF